MGLLWLLTLKASFILTQLPVSMATEMQKYRFRTVIFLESWNLCCNCSLHLYSSWTGIITGLHGWLSTRQEWFHVLPCLPSGFPLRNSELLIDGSSAMGSQDHIRSWEGCLQWQHVVYSISFMRWVALWSPCPVSLGEGILRGNVYAGLQKREMGNALRWESIESTYVRNILLALPVYISG